MSAYQYPSQVPRGQIRVLLRHTDQSLRTASGQILAHFTFQVVPLDSEVRGFPHQDQNIPLPYTALSYFWGDQKDKYQIAIDHKLFKVGLNLLAAISHLLKQFMLPYWIDAICINQNDRVEKESQISQMGDVYRNARRVVVWLGPGDAEYGKAISQIDEIGAAAQREGIEEFTAANMKQWPDFGADEGLNSLKTRLEKTMESSELGRDFPVHAFLNLTHNVWFERAWIVQELSVPRVNSVTFVCGLDQISYENLAAGYKLFLLWYGGHLRNIQAATDLPSELYQIFKFRARVGTFPRPPNSRAGTTLGFRKKYLKCKDGLTWKELLTFSYTLDSAKSLDCKEPADKIYALAGMACDTAFLDQARASGARTYQELYTSVARHLISKGNIDVLGLCCDQDRDSSLPSWVPDWTKPMRPPWGLYKEDRLFRAALQGSVHTSTAFSEPDILTLRSWHVDTINSVGAVWPASLDSFDWLAAKALLESVEHFLEQSKFYLPEERPDIVWRIPIGNKEQNKLMQTIIATSAAREGFEEMKKEVQRWKPGLGVYSVKLTSYMNMMWSMHESRAFISGKGYVGLCPATAKPGDTIYCVAGGHVPYIFRKSTVKGDKLVGEAYVQGIMHGEFNLEPAVESFLEIY